MKKEPKIFLISGPSGAGEDVIIDAVNKRLPLNPVITTVTRKMRRDESQGKPYYFIDEEEFKNRLENNEFAEWAYVYNCYRGCSHAEIERLLKIGKPIIWKLDWHGVISVKKMYPDSVSIFITVPDYNTLVRRLEKRGLDSPETIKEREGFTREWLEKGDVYDYVVVNKDGELDKAIDEVERIMRNEIGD